MSIEILFLALTLTGATLLALVAVRGIERVRFALAPKYRPNGIRDGKKLLTSNID